FAIANHSAATGVLPAVAAPDNGGFNVLSLQTTNNPLHRRRFSRAAGGEITDRNDSNFRKSHAARFGFALSPPVKMMINRFEGVHPFGSAETTGRKIYIVDKSTCTSSLGS